MKEVIFGLFVLGTIISWMIWAVLGGNAEYKQKTRMFMITGVITLGAAIGWSIRYGA